MSFTEVSRWDAKLQITSLQSLPSNTSAKSYALTAEQSKTKDGGLELEFVLSAKPNSNSINIPFSKENIILFYQPPLTEEFKQEDCEIWMPTHVKTKSGEECRRPENVVGSYAVYHSSKRNNEYKAGKICHIFTPKATDAAGKSVYMPFNRDANETGILTFTIPQNFLDSAVYPVTIDPTFGKTAYGLSTHSGSANYVRGSHYPLGEAGTVTEMTIYGNLSSGTSLMKLLIYDATPDILKITSTEETITNTLQEWDFPASGALTAAEYFLCHYFGTGDMTTYYDTGAANSLAYRTATYPTVPSPFGTPTYGTRLTTIWATYTAEGVAGQPYTSRVQRIPGIMNWGGN